MSRKAKRNRRRPDTDPWGICSGYEDNAGRWHPNSSRTCAAVRAAIGADDSQKRAAPVHVITMGDSPAISGATEIRIESGKVVRLKGSISANLPTGYHEIQLSGGRRGQLIVCPPRCQLPQERTWGWAVQLYALRSAQSWGIGDLADLRRLARWSARELGAGILQVSPLCAATPVLPQQPSPYYPSSRCFRNPLYLSIASMDGGNAPEVSAFTLRATALNRVRRIDRDAIFDLKMQALQRIHSRFRAGRAYEAYCARQGEPLRQFAVFCVLAERHGGDWRKWPARYRHPDSSAVTRFAAQQQKRVEFHKWLQWALDEQFRRAASEIRIIQDLPIGFDPAGFDAWLWQDTIAQGMNVGAPPDPFNAGGQDWGLSPFIPHRLRGAAFAPFIQTIRANLSRGGGLRLDHVMGLFRLFWIPEGLSAAKGCYVRCPADELMGILALESERAGAIVIGEDLGTVEKGVRQILARRGILSYRLLWFEHGPPEKYPELSLAAITTHDLPTIAGLWTGSDLADQQRLGLKTDERGFRRLQHHLRKLAGVKPGAATDEVIFRAHHALAGAASRIALATLEDALGVADRPNMPGTVDTWPNWSIALPKALEDLQSDTLVRRVAKTMTGR